MLILSVLMVDISAIEGDFFRRLSSFSESIDPFTLIISLTLRADTKRSLDAARQDQEDRGQVDRQVLSYSPKAELVR